LKVLIYFSSRLLTGTGSYIIKPIIRVNQPYISALRASHITGKQTLYWDEAQTGFAVLVSGKTNVKTYMAKGQLKRKAVLKKLGRVGIMTLDEVRQAAREMFRDLGVGVDPRKKKTVRALEAG
jgi:hypothetical protein